jgi:hypothetical protein
MHFDLTLLGPFAVVVGFPAALVPVWMAWMALRTGKVWVQGRREPYVRENEPVRYWIWTTLTAILAGVVLWTAVSLFTSQVTF